tara:strand:- start:1003 stop:1311 length:309 start_codon:yes stop_codon:yes gene_type:complete
MILPWIVVGFVSLLLLVSVYYNYKFALIVLRMEDALEKSLDVLDERYASISTVLEIPLFYDSPQVRQVISDIGACRNTILHVANQIGALEEITDGENQKKEN